MIALVPILVGAVLFVPVMLLIGAFFLKIAVRIVAGSVMPWGMACLTVFLVSVATGAVGLVLRIAIGMVGGVPAIGALASVGPVAANFLVGSVIYAFMVRDDVTGDPIGLGKGILVSLMQVVIGVVIVAGLLAIVFLVRGAAG